MKNIALLFPGQGAQYVGMGKEFYDQYEKVRTTFSQANDIIGFDLGKDILTGTEERLASTEITQPSVFLVDICCFYILQARYPELYQRIGFIAGHSLGEYVTLVAAGSLNFNDTFNLVCHRAKYMNEATQTNPGAMAAIIGLTEQEISELCNLSQSAGYVIPANYNCPGQIVISGEPAAVNYFCNLVKQRGKGKAIPLKVSGAFHSRLMHPASVQLADEINRLEFKNAQFPIVHNYDAYPETDAVQIKNKLILQIDHSVRWEQSVNFMLNQNVNTFIELGPGKVLSGLVKKCNPTVNLFNVQDMNSLNHTVEFLNSI